MVDLFDTKNPDQPLHSVAPYIIFFCVMALTQANNHPGRMDIEHWKLLGGWNTIVTRMENINYPPVIKHGQWRIPKLIQFNPIYRSFSHHFPIIFPWEDFNSQGPRVTIFPMELPGGGLPKELHGAMHSITGIGPWLIYPFGPWWV